LPQRQAGHVGDGTLKSLGAFELALGFIDSAAQGVNYREHCCGQVGVALHSRPPQARKSACDFSKAVPPATGI
jgi:hypothetical protein